MVNREELHRLDLEPADHGWPCAALVDELGNPVFDAPDCLGIVEYPDSRRSARLVWCSDYCGRVASLVRYRRRVEREGRHQRVADSEDVLNALWRKESDLLIGEFYQPHLTPKQREDIFGSKGRSCLVCGKPATDIDHIVPGGGDAPKNLQPLCASCHLAKTADQRGLYTHVPKNVAKASDAELGALLGSQLFQRAKSSGIGIFALTSKQHIARYAAYLARVYADPPRPCDDEETWPETERGIRKERRAELVF